MSTVTGLSNSPWVQSRSSVPAGNTQAVHSYPLATFSSMRIVICVYNKVQEKKRTFDLTISKQGAGLAWSVFGLIGDAINFITVPTVNGSNYELVITNNELYDLAVEYAYLPLGG